MNVEADQERDYSSSLDGVNFFPQNQSQATSLPNYNNNYEQRFQSLQLNSNKHASGIAIPSSYMGSSGSYHQTLNVIVFEVRFKCTKGDYLLADSTLRVDPGDFVKVEADRGYDIGIIYKRKTMIMGMEVPRKRILGHIGAEEMSILPHKIAEETQAVIICRQMAAQRGLLITIADVEFQFDRNKLTVIFASEGRIDFRELVRDMFSFFRIRIWMQKVSPSEAIALMELAAADNTGGRSSNTAPSRDLPPPLHNSPTELATFAQPRKVIDRSQSSGSGYTTGSGGDSPPLAASTSRVSSPPALRISAPHFHSTQQLNPNVSDFVQSPRLGLGTGLGGGAPTPFADWAGTRNVFPTHDDKEPLNDAPLTASYYRPNSSHQGTNGSKFFPSQIF